MSDPRLRARLEALSRSSFSVDLAQQASWGAAGGWRHDRYQAELPAEAPGPPEADGPFAAASQVLREYRFPPPDLITGVFLPDQPLEQRVMLLEARFLGLRFHFGVRVSGVVDETRAAPEGSEQVWGYRYATLEGHFERGQIEFLIAKRLATGRVEFRIAAVSQTGVIQNPLYRWGFRLFGRGLQKRFARQSLRRMQRLVGVALETGRVAGRRPEVRPAHDEPQAAKRLEEVTPAGNAGEADGGA